MTLLVWRSLARADSQGLASRPAFVTPVRMSVLCLLIYEEPLCLRFRKLVVRSITQIGHKPFRFR